MNRKLAPAIKDIENLPLPEPTIIRFSNNSALYLTHAPELPVVKLEITVMAGRPFEIKKIASKLTGRILKEGAARKSSKFISDFIDSFGASLYTSANLDYTTISLHCLQKYFDEVWPIVVEVLQVPDFPQKEIDLYIQNSIQKLEIDLTKPEVIAYRTLTEKIFGEDHPYGYNSTPELYNAIERDDLLNHFNTNFIPANTNIFLSGGFDSKNVDLIQQTLKTWSNKQRPDFKMPNAVDSKPSKIHLELPSSIQSALRIGRKMFGRSHPDYIDMFLLNTLLGGFFGSRLNMNIREAKGMTYNIGSSLDTLSFDGCLIIMGDMSHRHVGKATQQIFKEFDKLCKQPIGADELLQLKRYTLGTMLTAIDGPFNTSSIIKSFIADQTDLDLWNRAIARIHTIDAQGLMDIAIKYLQPDDFWIVSAGMKNEK